MRPGTPAARRERHHPLQHVAGQLAGLHERAAHHDARRCRSASCSVLHRLRASGTSARICAAAATISSARVFGLRFCGMVLLADGCRAAPAPPHHRTPAFHERVDLAADLAAGAPSMPSSRTYSAFGDRDVCGAGHGIRAQPQPPAIFSWVARPGAPERGECPRAAAQHGARIRVPSQAAQGARRGGRASSIQHGDLGSPERRGHRVLPWRDGPAARRSLVCRSARSASVVRIVASCRREDVVGPAHLGSS